MVLTMLPATALAAAPTAADSGYSDIDGHWAEEAIKKWSEYGIFQGNNGRFDPNGELTRAQAAVIFMRLLNLTEEGDISSFTDVDPEAWYAEAIAKCVAAGIMLGNGDGTMDPNGKLTREQLFVMFGRALGVEPADTCDKEFADSDSISSWAIGYINALVNMGAIDGMGDGSMSPDKNINRASIVALLDKCVIYVTEDGATVTADENTIVIVAAKNVTVEGNPAIVVNTTGESTEPDPDPDPTPSTPSFPSNPPIIVPQHTHVWTFVAGQAATCKTQGKKDHYTCTCGDKALKEANGTYTVKNDTDLVIAVDSGNHEGTKSGTWTYNTTSHWHVWSCCSAKADEANHSGGSATCTAKAVCSVCTQSYGEFANHSYDEGTHKCECGKLDPAYVVAVIGETEYLSFTEALSAAQTGDTITLKKDVTVTAQITLDKAITLDGDGKTITASGTWATGNDAKFLLNITVSNVKVENLTLDCGSVKAWGLNIYHSTGVVLNNVTVSNVDDTTPYAGMTVNGSTVTASNLSVDKGKYGSINVDAGGYSANPTSLTVTGTLTESGIWVDAGNTLGTGNGQVNVNIEGYKPIHAGSYVYTRDVSSCAAKIGNVYYQTLADAVNAVHTLTGDARMAGTTITLLKDASGGGFGAGYESINDHRTDGNSPVNITIDLGGHTYTLTAPTYGSAGTETNGFQLLKGSKVTFKNGTITTGLTDIIFQNYCDLTLTDMSITATAATYVVSCNYGSTVLTNVNITAGTDKTAIDLMHWEGTSYADKRPTMTINNTATNSIVGKIAVYCYGESCGTLPNLTIKGGSFTDLANAVKYAEANATITMLSDVTLTERIELTKSLNINLNGHRLAKNDGHVIVVVKNDAELKINGTVEGSTVYGRLNVGTSENNNGNLYLNGGYYYCVSNDTVLHVNGTCTNSDVGITGARIESPNDNGVQFNGKGNFSISNSTITGGTAVYIKSGTLTITKSALTGNLNPADYSYNGNGSNATGDALVVDCCGYPGGAPTITIDGDTTFTATKTTNTNVDGIGFYEYDDTNHHTEHASITVNGNTVTQNTTNP